MKLTVAFPVLFTIAAALAGCQPIGQKLPGTWTTQNGGSMVLSEDGKFLFTSGGQAMSGTWSFAEKKITMTVQQVAGKPIKDAITELENAMYTMPEDQAQQTKQMIDTIKAMQSGITGSVSEDGKVITTTIGNQQQTWNKREK